MWSQKRNEEWVASGLRRAMIVTTLALIAAIGAAPSYGGGEAESSWLHSGEQMGARRTLSGDWKILSRAKSGKWKVRGHLSDVSETELELAPELKGTPAARFRHVMVEGSFAGRGQTPVRVSGMVQQARKRSGKKRGVHFLTPIAATSDEVEFRDLTDSFAAGLTGAVSDGPSQRALDQWQLVHSKDFCVGGECPHECHEEYTRDLGRCYNAHGICQAIAFAAYTSGVITCGYLVAPPAVATCLAATAAVYAAQAAYCVYVNRSCTLEAERDQIRCVASCP